MPLKSSSGISADKHRAGKVLIGKERCFQQIEVTLIFDASRRLTDRQIAGGKFLDD